MGTHEVMHILRNHRDELRREFGVESLEIFGSVSRNQAGDASDVDLLVEFDRAAGFFTLFALQDRLERLLGRPVDLNTRDALKPRLRKRVLRECVRVA